jgi:hypothetical protein
MFKYRITQHIFTKLCAAGPGFFRTKQANKLIQNAVNLVRDKVGDEDADMLENQLTIVKMIDRKDNGDGL